MQDQTSLEKLQQQMELVQRAIPAAALAAARNLAEGCGHEWSALVTEGEVLSTDDIENRTFARRREDGELGFSRGRGIPAPRLNDDGKIYHRSATGRIEWEIDFYGTIEITINRPAGPALYAVLLYGDGPGEVELSLVEGGKYSEAMPEDRHYSTLEDCLLSLGVQVQEFGWRRESA